MHSTGYFVEDKRPFSDKLWGHRSAIYVKLAGELTDSQWTGFYGGLEFTDGINEKMREFRKPVEEWTNDPDAYQMVASDPIEGSDPFDERF